MDAITPRAFEVSGLPGRIYEADRSSGVVVIIEGYPDGGFVKHVGCRFMDMQWSVSMAQLIAASGMAAITYANRQPGPDAIAILDYAHANWPKVAVWATSGHAPVAISVLNRVSCAVLSNPVTTGNLTARVPAFVIRSGHDETPGLNAALDALVARALADNHPLTLVNYPEARHSFELYHDSSETRLILRQALEFLRTHCEG
jgi:hypothetical protein